MATRQSIQQEATRAVGMLEFFWGESGDGFDRTTAKRAVTESFHAIPGDGAGVWLQRLVVAGESILLRLRSNEATVGEALEFVRQGIPVGTRIQRGDGTEEWLGLGENRRGKVRVMMLSDKREQWISQRRLRRLLGVQRASDKVPWVLGQAALPCDASGPHEAVHGAHHTSPFARLLLILRPERSDLWVVLLFSVVVGILTLATPVTVEALVNTVAFGQYLQPVIVLSLILLTFLGFAAAIRAIVTWIVELLQRRLFVRVVEDLSYRLPRAETRAFDHVYGPELVNRFFDVTTLQKVAASLLLDGISIVLQTFIGMAVLAFYHPFLLGFDIVLLAVICFITFGLGRGAVSTAIKESKDKYRMAAWLQELVRNPTAFKFDGGPVFGTDRADKLAADYLESRRVHFRIVMRQICFALGLQAVAATTLLGLGGWLVIQQELTLGQLVAAELIVMTIVSSFAKMGKHLDSFYDLLAGVDKLGYLFDLPVERQDKSFHLAQGSPATLSVHHAEVTIGGKRVLKGVEFEVKAGESLALSGPSGAGKSLLADLVSGLRYPHKGYLQLDGVDLRELRPDSLREHVALCRDIDIFEGTIDENVRLNRAHLNVRDMRAALATVGLEQDVLEMADGVGTILRTQGRPLSTTQAMRLMLARALVGRPRLLVIDGALDRFPDAEAEAILETLLESPRPWTLLLITGRENLAKRCDEQRSLAMLESTAQSG